MRKLFWLISVPLLCSLALGQGGVIGPKGVIAKNGIIARGVAGGPTFTLISAKATLSFTSPYTINLTGSAAIGSMNLLMCGSDQANTGTLYNWVVADNKSNTWAYPNSQLTPRSSI
jgi:hypothetical protein